MPLLPGDFVTTEAGTGFVHIAPGHGEDDFALGRAHGLPVPETVNDDGTFTAQAPGFAGLHVFKAHEAIYAACEAVGTLVAKGKLTHSYPHSWRSKKPVIFRATPQWFIALDGEHRIRERALEAIAGTHFVPGAGRNRIGSMVASRPDWCVSRQRAWGVPIAVFVSKQSGEPLRDPAIMERIAAAFAEEGADAWYKPGAAERFLGPDRDARLYEQVMDIVDVWFESGCTHAFTLTPERGLPFPADLYLEGSDQHRGWFQSSLLESIGTRGVAPFRAVLTHGFTLDEQGRKMSKSLGNVTAPAGSDRALRRRHPAPLGDEHRRHRGPAHRPGDPEAAGGALPPHPQHAALAARRPRRLLGRRAPAARRAAGAGALGAPPSGGAGRPRARRRRLARLGRRGPGAARLLQQRPLAPSTSTSARTRSTATPRTARGAAPSARCSTCSTATSAPWLAPVLVFTAEEAWLARFGGEEESIHLHDFPAVPAEWRDEALAEKWARVREARRAVTRRAGGGQRAPATSARPCKPTIDLRPPTTRTASARRRRLGRGLHRRPRWTSRPVLRERAEGIMIEFAPAPGAKCARCWRVLPEVGRSAAHPGLCLRCEAVVEAQERTAAAA